MHLHVHVLMSGIVVSWSKFPMAECGPSSACPVKGGGMGKADTQESQSLGPLPTNSRSFRNSSRMTTPDRIGSSSLRGWSDDDASHIDFRRLLDCVDYTAGDSIRGDRYGPETFLDYLLRGLIGDTVAEVRRDHTW